MGPATRVHNAIEGEEDLMKTTIIQRLDHPSIIALKPVAEAYGNRTHPPEY